MIFSLLYGKTKKKHLKLKQHSTNESKGLEEPIDLVLYYSTKLYNPHKKQCGLTPDFNIY